MLFIGIRERQELGSNSQPLAIGTENNTQQSGISSHTSFDFLGNLAFFVRCKGNIYSGKKCIIWANAPKDAL